jgi:hypothetical protein
MTRKDYELIAKVFNYLAVDVANGDYDTITMSQIVENLSLELQKDNPRFNRARFLSACGVA